MICPHQSNRGHLKKTQKKEHEEEKNVSLCHQPTKNIWKEQGGGKGWLHEVKGCKVDFNLSFQEFCSRSAK